MTLTPKLADQVFCLRDNEGQPVWKILVNGSVFPAEWRDKGAAKAGLEVEQRRLFLKITGQFDMP